jgi:glyoxylase-like metal-dependent hydrolase (beta-lactamase superfamily II)
MTRVSFVTQMPNKPGALHRAAEIVKRYRGNINRIQYDRRIDTETVFFEVTCTPGTYENIKEELAAIGYLQTSLETLSFLKFHIHLPHRPGALFDFLTYTTSAGANIAYIDFDESGSNPDRVTVSLNVKESAIVDDLLNRLKSKYPIEILEYDTTGDKLDNTVFYVRFAQKIRPIIGDAEDGFILAFLHDINHIAQELNSQGEDPEQVFESILETGRTLNATKGKGFYADLQRIDLTPEVTLFCFQLPGGGNVFLLETADEILMVDTGYGIYHADIMTMFHHFGIEIAQKLKRIVVTHADADHCGGAGFFDVQASMHAGTLEIIREANRAYGSRSQDSVLEGVYTTMINLFSHFNPPTNIDLFLEGEGEREGLFPVLEHLQIGDLDLQVLESLGGHLHGQIFLLSRSHGLLFTSDSLMNFGSLTEERMRYNSLADFLVTSVNVDSELARAERRALLELAKEIDRACTGIGRQCLICGGHGAVSVLDPDGRLTECGETEHYAP